MDYLELFKSLPHINANKQIVEDWGYTPSLYHFAGSWYVSWVHCKDGDTLLDYRGDNPKSAIMNAYNHYRNDIGLSRFKIGDRVKIIKEYHIHKDETGVVENVCGDVYDVAFGDGCGCSVSENDIMLI